MEELKGLLNSRNLKATKTRLELLSVISNYGSAMPTALIQQKLPHTDRITLYRTIQIFLNKGIIHPAFSNTEGTYYALCGNTCSSKKHQHNHAHFTCTKCKAVTCENLENEITLSLPDFKIEKTTINLTGVCKHCFV